MAKLESSCWAGAGPFGRLALAALVGLGALSSGAGCASTELVAVTADESGVATARSESAEVRARVRTGNPNLPADLTPIEISVRSLGASGISLELDDIELMAVDGSSRPVPPEAIRPERPIGLGIDPASPFAAQGAQSSAAATTGSGRQGGGPLFEPTLTYAASGTHGDPMRDDIIGAAFSGGFIERGETKTGLVYFRVPEADELSLRIVVRPGSGSGAREILEIPFSARS